MARFKGLTINDTGNLKLPAGTNANRPGINATVQSFTTVGTTSWTAPVGVTSVEVLVVAGGGGGGRPYGGGGGAGGVTYTNNYTVTPGTSYIVTVGAGGSGLAANLSTCQTGNDGSLSKFDSLVATGGGGGGCWGVVGTTGGDVPSAGRPGGSGGGGGSRNDAPEFTQLGQLPGAGVSGQGNSGGIGGRFSNGGSGGGGGAGGRGETFLNGLNGASGGSGLEFTISGTPTWYAGGGAGGIGGGAGSGAFSPGIGGSRIGGIGGFSTNGAVGGSGENGVVNTGSGGGGAGGTGQGSNANTAGTSGSGGSGIVIVKYQLASNNELPIGQTRYNTNFGDIEAYSQSWKPKTRNTDIVKEGLILHFDAVSSAISGTTVHDISGNGYTGTLINGAGITTDNGGTFTFNSANNNYIQTNFNKNISRGFSLDFWFFATNTTTYFPASMFTSEDANTVFRIEINNELGRLDFGHKEPLIENIASTEIFGNNFFPNQWHHCTLVYDGNRKYIYNNAKLLSQSGNNNVIEAFAGATLRIGARQDGALLPINGNIGSFKIYNRALSVEEITLNHNAQAEKFFIPPIVNDLNIVTNGLIYNVDAGDPRSYSGVRSIINDTSPQGNTSSFQNVFVDRSQHDGAMSFNGTTSVVNSTFLEQVIDTVTMEAVIFNRLATARYRAIIQNNLRGDDALYIYPNGNLGFWPCGSDGPPVPLNQWAFVSVVYNGGSLEYRVNDQYRKVFMGCADITDFQFLRLGAHSTGDGETFDGFIAYARVYNRALTPQEVQQNFNAVRGRFGI